MRPNSLLFVAEVLQRAGMKANLLAADEGIVLNRLSERFIDDDRVGVIAITCGAKDPETAEDLAEGCIVALHGKDDVPLHGKHVSFEKGEGDISQFDPERELFIRQLDFVVTWK